MPASLKIVRGLRLLQRIFVIATAFSMVWTAASPVALAASESERSAEYQIKAAFIYKFSSYVEWPEVTASKGPFTIAVMGADTLAKYLVEMVKDRTVEGRPVEVRALTGEAEPDLSGVHVLFIGDAVRDDMASILASVGDQPVLTITESDPSQSDGGVINFVVVDNKVRFDIALTSAEQRKLKISARLLEVARKVVEQAS